MSFIVTMLAVLIVILTLALADLHREVRRLRQDMMTFVRATQADLRRKADR